MFLKEKNKYHFTFKNDPNKITKNLRDMQVSNYFKTKRENHFGTEKWLASLASKYVRTLSTLSRYLCSKIGKDSSILAKSKWKTTFEKILPQYHLFQNVQIPTPLIIKAHLITLPKYIINSIVSYHVDVKIVVCIVREDKKPSHECSYKINNYLGILDKL